MRFEAAVLSYLSDLEGKNYPLNVIPIQYSGYLTDNSPPSTVACEMIKKWNQKYSYPKLKSAIVSDFFELIEKEYASDLPVYRAAWPDWWTDGFGASAREVMAMREAQVDLISANGGSFMAGLSGIPQPSGFNERIRLANDALLYFGEHTVSYSESVRQPFGKNTMEQRSLKEAYAWEGLRRAQILKEEALGLLQSVIEEDDKVTINVFNTLNWPRSGMSVVYIDHQILNPIFAFETRDMHGRELKMQPLESRSDGTYWALWIENVPALGYKKYYLSINHIKKNNEISGNKYPGNLSNDWYDLKIDLKNGVINSFYDKEIEQEFIDPGSEWKMGQFIYEQLGNRNQMERFTLEDYTRTAMEDIQFTGYKNGRVWQSIYFKGSSTAAMEPGGCTFEIRLFNTEKRVDLLYSIIKKPIVEPEGIYISMPFNIPQGKIFFDVPGGVIRAGYDQIPGSANDWNTVQNFVSIRNDAAEIIITPYEAPLMQFGAINTGRYQADAKPPSTHIFGWPMNNYWTTNFNADQTGYHEWHYSITSQKVQSYDSATRKAYDNRVPFLVRVLPPRKKTFKHSPLQVLTGLPQNVILINSILLTNNTALLQLRESAGIASEFILRCGTKKMHLSRSNALAEKIREINRIKLNPYECAFILLTWQDLD